MVLYGVQKLPGFLLFSLVLGHLLLVEAVVEFRLFLGPLLFPYAGVGLCQAVMRLSKIGLHLDGLPVFSNRLRELLFASV